jgi:hypothetical protein
MGAEASIRYPTKAAIERAVQAAKACGLDVAGFEIGPNGIIRIMEPRSAQANPTDFDRWADKL